MEPPIQTEYLDISLLTLELFGLVSRQLKIVSGLLLSLWRSYCLDLHGGGGESGELLLHPVSDAGVHGGAAREDDVGVEVLPDVHVALHDRVEGGLVHPAALHPDERGLEQRLGSAEPLVADGDHLGSNAS